MTVQISEPPNRIPPNRDDEREGIHAMEFRKARQRTKQMNLIAFVMLLLFSFTVTPFVFAASVQVIPGGQTIGIQIQSQGLLVVGKYRVNDQDANPTVRVGDRIMSVNGSKVTNVNDFRSIVQELGAAKKEVTLTIVRDGTQMNATLIPQYDASMKTYRAGLYVRDQTIGIGTLSFIVPEQHLYGALGHPITDPDSKSLVPITKGLIFPADVTGFRKGTSGIPGEKHAQWSNSQAPSGTIERNTRFGIFGTWNNNSTLDVLKTTPMQVALPNEVHVGDAELLTSIHDNKVEHFKVQIIQTVPQAEPEVKSMLIKVTDERLLTQTGGIVQGMSGSPIVQDGKLVGVLTHVLVNQPTVGFAAYMEWMLREAGVIGKQNAA